MRTCNRCGMTKNSALFARSRQHSDGYHGWCKACKAAVTRMWQNTNAARIRARDRAEYAADGARQREQARRWHRENLARSKKNKRSYKLRRYGLTIEEYDAIAAAQDRRCAICLSVAGDLVVDHCHERQFVRGLLCRQCNLGLGFFEDSTDVMRAAIEYLNRPRAKKTA